MTAKWTREPPTARGRYWVAFRHIKPPRPGRAYMHGTHDGYTAAVADVFGPFDGLLHITFEGLACAFPFGRGCVADFDVWYGSEPLQAPPVPAFEVR